MTEENETIKPLKVLVACEYSGTVREAFRTLGHDAWSCDILPSDDDSDYHIQSDVKNILSGKFDLMVAHPPCTYLSNSGVSWLHKRPERWKLLDEGAAFFKELLEFSEIDLVAVENPIPHKYAVERFGGKRYSQLIHPWQYGHPEKKATCLWLRNLPKLVSTNDVKAHMLTLHKRDQQRLHYLPPSADRAKLRSKTFQGIADAMAMQWGGQC